MTTLKGIDISNYQKDLTLANLVGQIDFVIVKGTEGTSYVNPSCDKFYQQAIRYELLRGFYHVMTGASGKSQADYMLKHCENYFHDGIPVLDVEGYGKYPNDPTIALAFLKRIEEKTGVKPLVYMNAACRKAKDWTEVAKAGFDLWGANYWSESATFADPGKMSDPDPWPYAAIWQFTSSGKLKGYGGKLDLDLAYMTKAAWGKYANPTGAVEKPVETVEKSVLENSDYRVTIERK